MEEKTKIKTLDTLSTIIIMSIWVCPIFMVLERLRQRVHADNSDIMEIPLLKYVIIALSIVLVEVIMRFIAGSITEKNKNKYFQSYAGLMYVITLVNAVVFTAAACAAFPTVIENNKDITCISVFVLVLTLLLYIYISVFLRHIMMYRRKRSSNSERNNLSSIVIFSLSILASFYIFCLATVLFVSRSGGGNTGWLKDMWVVVSKKDYIFSSRFIVAPIKADIYKKAFMVLVQNTVMMRVGLIPVGIYGLQILKDLYTTVREGFKEQIDIRNLTEKWRALRDRILFAHKKIAASPKGYCMQCKRKQPLYLMLPYGVNTLDIHEDDIVENAVEQQKAMLRKRSAMELDKYSIKITILKLGTKIVSKSGAKVSPKYCCAKCYSTVYRPIARPFFDTNKVINISLIGDRNTAKTCFCASTAKAHPNMMLRNTPEYVYFRAFTERLEEEYPRAPLATPSDMIASPVLTIKYDGHIVGITDIAGENFTQAADTVRRDDVIGLFVRADNTESIASAYSVLTQLSYKIPLIVICITRADELEYYDKIYEAMSINEEDLNDKTLKGRFKNTKKIGKNEVIRARSEKLHEILSYYNGEFDNLYRTVQQHTNRVEIAAHCALGTSVNNDLYLEGDYAPEFIDETLDALCSEKRWEGERYGYYYRK